MINLLPLKEKKQLKQEYISRVFTVSFSMISVLAVIASLFLAPSYKYSVSKESIAENNLEIFNAQNPQIDIDKLNQDILKTNEKLSFIISKKPNFDVSVSVIEKILGLRTSGISFNQISYQHEEKGPSTVHIVGVASDRAALRSFKDSLSSDPIFSTVDLPISNFIKPTNIDFNMFLTLK